MPTTRRALLISNPGETGAENYCKGVFVDVANYNALFLSPQGGWWEATEIAHLNQPSVVQVKAAIQTLAGHEYSFVAFSGHGWYSSIDRATILTLRKGENISEVELLKDSNKRTLILDCCRKVYHEPLAEAVRHKYAMARALERRAPHPMQCREEFFRSIQLTPNSIVVVHSCAKTETSGDDETEGGRYTSSLIGTAAAWSEEKANGRASIVAESLSIVATHGPAATSTRDRSGGTQNPDIEKPKSAPYFPFAVFA